MVRWILIACLIAHTGAKEKKVEVTKLPGANQLPTHFFEEVTDISLITDTAEAYVKRACPGGIEKCECTFSEGPFNPNEDLLGSIFAHLGCNPSHCICKNDPTKTLVDIRPQYFRAFMDLCPKNELNRCLCHDAKRSEKAPFDILKTLMCRPKKCKCNGSNEVKVVQEFGCEKGGYPICKNEPGTFNLVCKDGTKLTLPYILQWNIDTLSEQWRLGKDFQGCICPDGIMPRCRTTKKMIECPNGDPVDMDKYPGYIEYNGCKIKDW